MQNILSSLKKKSYQTQDITITVVPVISNWKGRGKTILLTGDMILNRENPKEFPARIKTVRQ